MTYYWKFYVFSKLWTIFRSCEFKSRDFSFHLLNTGVKLSSMKSYLKFTEKWLLQLYLVADSIYAKMFTNINFTNINAKILTNIKCYVKLQQHWSTKILNCCLNIYQSYEKRDWSWRWLGSLCISWNTNFILIESEYLQLFIGFKIENKSMFFRSLKSKNMFFSKLYIPT